MMSYDSPAFWLSVLQIIWIDLLLSGDNAVVIALACRKLPQGQRKWGMLLGAGAAVGLRIVFALIVSYLLGLPFLKLAGGLLLLWIAVKLLTDNHDDGHHIESADSLWKAVQTIAIADAVMSLDNVVAIAAAAKGHPELFIFGLLLSIPLIIGGSTLLITLLQRFPILVWAGAALLGWIAGEMIVGDKIVLEQMQQLDPSLVVPKPDDVLGIGAAALPHYGGAVVGAAIVIAIGLILKARRPSQPAAEEA